jgi:hypothetical protein
MLVTTSTRAPGNLEGTFPAFLEQFTNAWAPFGEKPVQRQLNGNEEGSQAFADRHASIA